MSLLSHLAAGSWKEQLQSEFAKPYMRELEAFLESERQSHEVYPPPQLIFNALNLTALEEVAVVILGQDPYHGPGQAHGLAFSVPKEIKIPPSLRNIYKEVEASTGSAPLDSGDLSHWAKQGVLLLNTSLTVRRGEPQSHAKKGWQRFSDRIIEIINSECENVVFMLWGKPAQAKAALINAQRHLVLSAPHPSPLSAHRGFLGCNHFAVGNEYRKAKAYSAIDWVGTMC